MSAAPPSRRGCRSCGAAYEFPLPGSPATRTHCADCAGLPAPFRRALERLQRRIEQVESAVRKGPDGRSQ